jgi:type I restriction enzyme S subunit
LLSGGTPSKANPSFWRGSIPWFSSKEIRNFELSRAELHVSEAGADQGSNRVPPGTVLFVVRGMSLANEFRVGVTTVPATFNQDVKALMPGADMDSRYLARCLRWLESMVLSMTEESSHGTKRLPGHVFEQLPIPVPPLPEQRRIADILDKADAVRRKRKEAISLTEELLRSAFLEMFGDPVTNPKGWPVESLADIVQTGTIVTYGIVQAGPEVAEGVPYIRTGDIQEGRILESRLLRTSQEIADKYKRSEVRAGDLVMSIRATVGTVATVPPSLDGANLTQGTARIAPGPRTLAAFLLAQLRAPGLQRWLTSHVKGATFKEITLGALRTAPIMVPPVEAQAQFARIVSDAARLGNRQGLSLDGSEQLFGTLVQRAFRGELSARSNKSHFDGAGSGAGHAQT